MSRPRSHLPPSLAPGSALIQTTVLLVLVVEIFYYLLKGIDLGQVWAEIQAMTWLEDATLLAIAAWNLAPTPWCGRRSPPGCRLGGPWSWPSRPPRCPTVGPDHRGRPTSQMLGSWAPGSPGRGRRLARGPAADAAALTRQWPANKVVGSG